MPNDKRECSHRNVRGPVHLGETGPICEDCGETLPCTHPPHARQRQDLLGGEFIEVCTVCGEQTR